MIVRIVVVVYFVSVSALSPKKIKCKDSNCKNNPSPTK